MRKFADDAHDEVHKHYDPESKASSVLDDNDGGHHHSHEVPGSIAAVAWMVIAGDGFHNFVDGVAIGQALSSMYIRSSPGDVLDLLLEVMSVRPYVHKKFAFDFHLIWCVARPRPDMRTRVTSTRSKVKVKVTGLLNFGKLHFSRSIPPPFWGGARNRWYICDSYRCPILEFLSRKAITGVQTSRKWPYFGTA